MLVVDTSAVEQVLLNIGPRIKQVRATRKLTLAEVARESGMSVSTLSRLENGQRKATLELLLPLAMLYQLPLDDLIGAPRTGDPRIDIRPLYREGTVRLQLSHTDGGIDAFKHVIPGRTTPQEPKLRVHKGYEWLYVLSGTLRLALDEREFMLTSGMAAEFDAFTPHWFGAASAQAVEFITLHGSEGQRAHTDSVVGELTA